MAALCQARPQRRRPRPAWRLAARRPQQPVSRGPLLLHLRGGLQGGGPLLLHLQGGLQGSTTKAAAAGSGGGLVQAAAAAGTGEVREGRMEGGRGEEGRRRRPAAGHGCRRRRLG